MEDMEIVADYPVIEELDDEYRVHVDVMGAQPQDVFIDVRNGEIEVFAKTQHDIATEDEFIRAQDHVYHSIPIPEDADVARLECYFSRQHLDIILPRG
jgi:HSP20 family molecular chaperone IbpA